MLEDETCGDNSVPDDLPFDVGRHLEALRSMRRLGLDPRSIRPALIARERAVFGSPGSRIQIRHDVPGEQDLGAIVEQIHSGDDPAEGAIIRQDVESYFLRHFPGRTTATTGPASGDVYIVCQPAPAAD